MPRKKSRVPLSNVLGLEMRVSQALQDSGLLVGLNAEEVEVLSRHAERRDFATNEIVARRSFPRHAIAVLLDGAVALTQKNARERREAQVSMEVGPAFLGLAEWALEAPWAHTVRTVTESRVVFVEDDVFGRVVGGHPELLSGLLRVVAAKALQAEAELVVATAFDTRSRILRFVLRYATVFGERRGSETLVSRRLRQAEIATALGLTQKTVQRTLAPLRKRGLLRVDANGYWTLRDLGEIHRMLPHEPVSGRETRGRVVVGALHPIEATCVSSTLQ